MKVDDLVGDELVEVRRISEDLVELVFSDVERILGDKRVLRIKAGVCGSVEHPDGVAELWMNIVEAAAEEEGP